MLFNAVLGDLWQTFLFVPQTQWVTFNSHFVVTFIGKTHKSFLKS